ncbi:MAG: AMP-binding protein, partial [Gemmatimonadota bacterium]|nr:AMP-binding protein [Gemmatimonadota bacterium]
MPKSDIENLLTESRSFPPSDDFSKNAHCSSIEEYRKLYEESLADPETFWTRVARELHWFEPWSRVSEWNPPHAKWFIDGKTNISYNCLDRHLDGPNADKPAYLWEGEPGDKRTLTYRELHSEVCKFANVLKSLGVGIGDRVCIYMPMVPELPIAMLACARIGAAHSVVFGGFSANALVDRINDAEATVVITADGGWRRGQNVPLKAAVDEALDRTPSVEHVVVLKRTESEVQMKQGRDVWWHELMQDSSDDCPATPVDSEQLLYILYTSGTTGKPKGIVHTTGGYMVGTYLTSKYVFDLKDDDVYWCTADIGWVTGHSYIVYGPLANGVTSVMYEGAPNYP